MTSGVTLITGQIRPSFELENEQVFSSNTWYAASLSNKVKVFGMTKALLTKAPTCRNGLAIFRSSFDHIYVSQFKGIKYEKGPDIPHFSNL
jgi:hypothetical protein